MNASQSAWQRGKLDYKLGIAYQENPYKNLIRIWPMIG